MARMSIGEVANLAGVRPSTIRYYEKAGLLSAPERVGGQRVFDDAALDDLTFIRSAREAGFGITEIRTMVQQLSHLPAPGDRWRTVADAKIAEIDAQIEELEHRRRLLECYRRCDCPSLEHYRLGS